MKNLVWLLALMFSVGCASDGPSKPDCTAPETLRTLTLCASPQSADLSVYNAEARKANRQGDESYNPVPLADSPTQGPDDAVVTIVMFTDLQCPFCSKAHEQVKGILAANPDVRLVFKHYPLPFHEAAIPMGIAAIDAGEQGKFWEYVDAAYAGQQDVNPARLKAFAEEVGLDIQKFTESFGSEDQIAVIQRDVDLGRQVGVTGTPTFFVNGVRIEGMGSSEDFQAVVDEQRELVKRLRDAGVDKEDIYWRTVALNFEAPPEPEEMPEVAEPQAPPVIVSMVPIEGTPVRGAATYDALITVVVFSDFECPFCGRAEATMAALREKYPQARFAFRHFPLPFHKNAMPAASASLAAVEAGKFWEFHDLLFANQDALTVDDLVNYGKQVGVKEAKIREAAGETPAQVLADMKLATQVGVSGTPSFFINGINISGARPFEDFAAVMDDQLKLAQQLQTDSPSLKGEALYEALVQANTAIQNAPEE
ncbi:MAG: thioredoxin domain-containing protein [bacterium]